MLPLSLSPLFLSPSRAHARKLKVEIFTGASPWCRYEEREEGEEEAREREKERQGERKSALCIDVELFYCRALKCF